MTVDVQGVSTRQAATDSELDAARTLLARMGIAPAELLDIRSAAPTFAEYIPKVRTRVAKGTFATYDTHWKRLEREWGARRIDEPTVGDIIDMRDAARRDAKRDRNARDGRGAAESMVSAVRCLYRNAENDGWIRPGDNPARSVAKPRRAPATRRGLSLRQLADITRVAATTGNDTDLDSLLLRLHSETACRRGGALALRPEDLDPQLCLIFLREKGETARWQPVSPTLMAALVDITPAHRCAGVRPNGRLRCRRDFAAGGVRPCISRNGRPRPDHRTVERCGNAHANDQIGGYKQPAAVGDGREADMRGRSGSAPSAAGRGGDSATAPPGESDLSADRPTGRRIQHTRRGPSGPASPQIPSDPTHNRRQREPTMTERDRDKRIEIIAKLLAQATSVAGTPESDVLVAFGDRPSARAGEQTSIQPQPR